MNAKKNHVTNLPDRYSQQAEEDDSNDYHMYRHFKMLLQGSQVLTFILFIIVTYRVASENTVNEIII